MLSVLIDIFRLMLWLALLASVFVPLERLFVLHRQPILRKEIATDLGYFFLSGLVPALLLSLPLGLVAFAVHGLVPDAVLEATGSLPLWARVLGTMLVGEFGYYWGHRWSHEIPILWRFHAIHHSAKVMDFLVHTRVHPIDFAFSRLCALVPVYALGLGGPGLPQGTVLPVGVVLGGTAWGFFVHANVRWRFGILEWLVSTPGFHHWHHTLTGPVNRNYASTFPWLDAVFGSLYLPADWPKEYGIPAPMPSALTDQLVHPLYSRAPESLGDASGV